MSRKILDMQRTIVKKRMQTKYRYDCMYRVEIDDQPSDLDLFTKEVSYGKGTIETKTLEVRTGEFNIPNKRTAGSVTVIFEDDDYGKVSKFITKLQKLIFNDDGTQNLPIDYLKKLRIYRLKDNGEEWLDCEWDVYVEENSDYSGNNESVSEHGTFSVTFKKFKSIGGKL